MDKYPNIKTEIRSLLTSSKDKLSVEDFQKQFLDMLGYNIPYIELGFNSIIELLTYLNDVVTVSYLQVFYLYLF